MKQSLPEWNSGSAESGICAYVRGSQTPKVKIRFRYLPAKDQPPVSVKIGIKNQLLGECISNEVKCMVNQVYETEAIARTNHLKEAFMGKYKDNFSCFYQETGIKRMLRTANMVIHVLCGEPQTPWGIRENEKNPMIPMLDYAAEIAERNGKVAGAVGFMEAAALWLSGQSQYKLENAPKYSRRTVTDVEFCLIKFLAALSQPTMSAGELDYYMFIAELAAMEGIGLTVYEIFSMEKGRHNWKGQLAVSISGIDRKEDSTIFGNPCPAEVRNCYVISNKMDEKASYWDLLLKVKSSTGCLKNLTWEEYRNRAFSEYTYVYEPIPVVSWKEVSDLPKQPLSVIFDTDISLFVSDNRWDFKPYVKSWHSYPDNKACCHRISYHTAERILATTFNQLRQNKISKDQKDEILDLLLKSFYPLGRPGEFYPEQDRQNYDSLQREINRLKQVTAQQLQNQQTCITTGKRLDQVLNCLNSALPNLKDGYASWNSSIGENYDFSDWECVIDGYKVFSNKGLIEPPIQTDQDQGFYLTEWLDGRNVHTLKLLERVLQEEFLDTQFGAYSKWADGGFVYYPVIYSSKNEFLLSKVHTNMIILPYYYINPDTKIWEQIW